MNHVVPRCEIDGQPADAALLAARARLNHGHYTSMQVRGGAVRGLGLHLARLDGASRALYDVALDPQRVREAIRHALRSDADATVRVDVFARDWRLHAMPLPATLALMVTMTPPAALPATPLRLRSVEHERFLPHIKHVGTFPLFELRRQAQAAGFDDALFLDRHDHIAEGTTWNIGFWDGRRVLWPEAPQLAGTSMQLLRLGLARAGIGSETLRLPRAALADMRGAFVCNASGVGRAVRCIDTIDFPIDDALLARIAACHDTQPLEPI